MGEERKHRLVEYENNHRISVSLEVLKYLLQPGTNPETIYGVPYDAEIVGIKFDVSKAMIILMFDRPVPPVAHFRGQKNPRMPKQLRRRRAN